jgi:E3 ubiquitin-protein ligase synoviolin
MSLLASLRSTFSNMQLYGLVSTSLFVWTLLSAFRQRSNFYSAAVYLSKSNACMMVSPSRRGGTRTRERRGADDDVRRGQILWNQGIYQLVLLGKLMQKVFFGELRMVEVEVSSSGDTRQVGC